MSNKKNVVAIDAPQAISLAPDQFISIEEVARRLRTDVPWVREKIRRRCPNPMPVFNLGRHLVFDWAQVVHWVRNLPRPIHAAHHRRWKKKPEGKAA
jgi:hypothetical protein